jgi:hypothetical protein
VTGASDASGAAGAWLGRHPEIGMGQAHGKVGACSVLQAC